MGWRKNWTWFSDSTTTKQQQKRKNYKIDSKYHESFGYTSDSSVTLGKLFDLSDPQFPLRKMRIIISDISISDEYKVFYKVIEFEF